MIPQYLLLISVLVVGLGYALIPQIFSLGLDDREPPVEQRRIKELREEKQKWVQGVLDLDTEWEVGTLEESEYRKLRETYKRKAIRALRELKALTEKTDEGKESDNKNLDEEIEASILEKKEQISRQ
jgi:hypothetical protein